MKIKDIEKLKNARSVINLLMEGINPVNKTTIKDESFLNDPSIIRMFSYIALVLTEDIRIETDKKEKILKSITEIDPNGNFSTAGINESYKSINEKINSSKIEIFNKAAISPELKKLAKLIEKELKES